MEKEKEYWHYIVRQDYVDELGEHPKYYWNENKSEALKRANGFMKMAIENLCTDYKMGKLPAGLPHKIIFRLFYSESFDGGVTYTEEILEEQRLADYLGNHPIE
jgi:hypothetical protein